MQGDDSCKKSSSKAAEDHLGVAADFVFFGRFVRIALFLALGTGMICAFRIEKSEAFNITQTVLAFKELGGTGRSVEFFSDCDDYLIKLVREASKRETFGSKGVNFRPAPVGRPQYKGRIERMVLQRRCWRRPWMLRSPTRPP